MAALTLYLHLNGIPFEVSGVFDPGEPAKLYGPPEDCDQGYPPEFELIGAAVQGCDYDLYDVLSEEALSKLQALALKHCLRRDD